MQVSSVARGERLLHAFWMLRQTMLSRVKPVIEAGHGLGMAELILLRSMAQSQKSPSELATEMQIPAPAISRKLDLLESKRLITRTLDEEDARRRIISLTTAGEEVLRAANQSLEREIGKILEVLSPGELERFFSALETIARPDEDVK